MAVLCLILACVCGHAQENLLPNGDFERWAEGWSLETGRAGVDVGGPNRISWPTGVARSGDRCARFDFTGKTWLWLDASVEVSARLPLKPADAVELVFWGKWLSGDNRVSAGFNFRGKTDGAWGGGRDHLALATIPKDGKWHRIEMSLVAPWFDAETTCIQLKLGAHSDIHIKRESFLVDDLSMRVVAPAHRLRLRFEDGTPEDGWGTNLHSVALFVNDASTPSISFECDTAQEKAFLVEDKSSFTWEGTAHVRVVDAKHYCVYELPVHTKDLTKLTVETEMFGTFLMRLSLDNGLFVVGCRAQKPIQSAQNRRTRRLHVLPLSGRDGLVLSDGKLVQGIVRSSLALDERLPEGSRAQWLAGIKEGGKTPIPAPRDGVAALELRIEDTALAAQDQWLVPVTLRINGRDGTEIARTDGAISVPNAPLLAKRLSELEEQKRQLTDLLGKATAAGVATHDADIVLAGLKRYPAFVQEDFDNAKIHQAAAGLEALASATRATIAALKTSLEAGEKDTAPAMPSVLGLEVRDGGLYQGDRPVFLIGPMRDRIRLEELETIAELGFNAVELVVAPRWDSPEDYQYYGDFLDLCAKRNIAAYVLLSSHYFPKSWFDEHPEMAQCKDFCLPWCICSPHLRVYLEEWYDKIIPFLRDKPAVFSYCLANEPHYINTGYCDVCKAAFRKWLGERYATIEALNERWGTQLADFAQIKPVKQREKDNAAAYYDWWQLNDWRMGDLFRWERKVVKALDPRTPIHNESMAWLALSSRNDGLDFEDQAALSDIHGCDGGTRWRGSGGKYAIDWLSGQSLPYDLMKSISPDQPIFNSEWHIVTQSAAVTEENARIPPEYMRATAWLAALHGQAGATIWVWSRGNCCGQPICFMTRPGIVIAAGKVTRELNGFAEQLALFQRPPAEGHREVCLLYSTSSLAHDPGYGRACRAVYEGLYFLDTPLGFVTERQAERGDFGGCKVLIVPQAGYATDACVSGLERFVAGGGTLVLIGECLTHNEYGEARSLALGEKTGGTVVKLSPTASPSASAAVFDKLIDASGVDRPVRSEAQGVVCRTALDTDRHKLVCLLINLTHEQQSVTLTVVLPHGEWRDLLTGEAVRDELSLGGLQVALLEAALP